MHRREWYCKLCNSTIFPRTAFQSHLEVEHSNLFIQTQLQVIIDRCERPTGANRPCPFCLDEILPSRIQRHLGRHMQQIALFVLSSFEEEIQLIRQQINGRYITLTVLIEYLKKRWPTTRTEIDVSHFSPTRILLANSRN